MSSRYDSRTTMFSPEGRLHQVEYAAKAITNAASTIGILTKEGVVFAAEKQSSVQLLDVESPEDKNISGNKMFKIADHVGCAVAGITADANILIQHCRVTVHRHEYQYQEPMPAEDLCQTLCDLKQGYTQYGGVRPFGVSFLFGAWDKYHGFQLYETDPSGNYSAWKAYAIGQNDENAQSLLKQDWKEGMTLREGIVLAMKLLSKTMDMAEVKESKFEIATLSKQPGEQPKFQILDQETMKPMAAEVQVIRKAEIEEENK